ncbi:MAG: cytochrome c oxidase subunit II [Propylenella sp.]
MALAARLIAALTWLAAASGLASAQDGAPVPWQMDSQAPATYVMEYIHWFSWYTLIIVTLIVIFVLALIGWCAVKYNERAHPAPSRVTHNTLVEVLWTVIPVAILVAIAIPSFKLLYGQYDPSKLYENFDPNTPFLTVKVTGVQWAWDVSYPNDEENVAMGVAEPISLYVLPIPDDQIDPEQGQIRNLSVDNPVVVPVDTFVRLQVTADGAAIHAFAMPAFGLKEDAVPGRLNETYFKADREGIFYGQCSELCGKDHAFMPIAIRVVSQERFKAWAAAAPADPAAAYESLAEAMRKEKQDQKLVAR